MTMKLTRAVITLSCLTMLAGCAGMFGRSTDDPRVMLQWASEEFSQRDDPFKAEELIQDALQVFHKNGDRLGKAEAYRQYALLLRSNAVRKNEKRYLREGFLDPKIVFTDRYNKAVEFFKQSREIYAEENRYDKLSNIDIGLAKTYAYLNRNLEACDSLASSLVNYNAYKKANPEMKEFHAEEVADYEDYVKILEKQLSCPPAPVVEEKKGEPQEEKIPISSHSMGSPE
jgi:hypothetical protein